MPILIKFADPGINQATPQPSDPIDVTSSDTEAISQTPVAEAPADSNPNGPSQSRVS